MITKYFGVGAVVLLLVGWGIAPAAASYLIGDWYEEKFDALGKGVDVWKLVCPSGTSTAAASIYDLSNDEDTRDGIVFTLLVVKSTSGTTMARHAPMVRPPIQLM